MGVDTAQDAPAKEASILHVVPAGVIWGFSFLCIKVAIAGMTPITLTALRIALGCLVVLVAARVTRARLPKGRAEWGLVSVYAVVATAVPFTLFGWAEERVPSALAGVLNGSTPLFTLAFGLLVDHRTARVSRRAAVGLCTGLAGVAMAAGLGGGDLRGADVVWGALACALAAACYGVGFVFVRQRMSHLGVVTISAGQLIVASAFSVPLGVASALTQGFELTPTRVLAVVVLGCVGTGAAFLFNMRAIALVGATRASLVTYVIPVVAVAVGVAFLDEPFTWNLVAGAALVIVGVALSRR